MFEKSLYDLIRGLRHHKGSEREYIQNSLRECRNEIRGADMDLKATALLKLVYLEMFGHDMSWAAFNVLEVMSSPKYLQKRVGYLGAMQSFRPDTEVLMLATNLLKKDISSSSIPTISLPLITLPHLATPSLAMSVQSDLMPRLTHSNPSVRKKTIVTLYRLALVYPETLRPAWPKIKDVLMDEDQDASVTAAVVNVVCELGWRRPQDFLPLAPRFFDLLVEGGNNWMAIKIIKLFATLTPLEPRLVKKLVPPLTNLIRTTPAMSLLYECIHGIIQGGILESSDNFRERDELAELCVDKLRGMIVLDRDPNLKYVALLAFKNIVRSHPDLVEQHQDVILDCINDPDISIRLQALELGAGMINIDNLTLMVGRLMQQLRDAPSASTKPRAYEEAPEIEPIADSDDDDPESQLRPDRLAQEEASPLPDEYRTKMIYQILDMCGKDSYANVPDFEWYVDVLVELVRLAPSDTEDTDAASSSSRSLGQDVATAIGTELRNIGVRVSAVRAYVVRAAYSLIATDQRYIHFPAARPGAQGVLAFAAWIVGEYATLLQSKRQALNSLLVLPTQEPAPLILCAYIQAIAKVIASIFASEATLWGPEQQTMTSLLLARIVHFLEPLTTHSNLEVQERAVEFAELFKLAGDAVQQEATSTDGAPVLITTVIPSLFNGVELGPVAASAQRKVPAPEDIDLSVPLNVSLATTLQKAEQDDSISTDFAGSYEFYYEKPTTSRASTSAAASLLSPNPSSSQHGEPTVVDPQARAALRAEREERQRDDPFYIGQGEDGQRHDAVHDILKANNIDDADIEAIPIMDLNIHEGSDQRRSAELQPKSKQRHRQHVAIAAEETLDDPFLGTRSLPLSSSPGRGIARSGRPTHGLLQVDSSGLQNLSLTGASPGEQLGPSEYEKRAAEEAEMARALAEVDRLRMEMQRASEQLQLREGIPDEGEVVKKKKKKKAKKPTEAEAHVPAEEEAEGPVVKKKKKKRKTAVTDAEEPTRADE